MAANSDRLVMIGVAHDEVEASIWREAPALELPLFPLNAVLFPGATLPLHIFEERYKQMIRHCLEEKTPFGVMLIRKGNEVGEPAEPFAVGTTAHIARAEHLQEGRMNLICLGGQRFRLLKTLRSEPYLVGEVEALTTIA